jgi:hypothetical protein
MIAAARRRVTLYLLCCLTLATVMQLAVKGGF